ncbi:MAG: acetolactate synthase small subunit [Nitrospinota bacterium]|nr:acetolactate synthase small subunit [Nitrospinota bacterium]MDH5677200.1 acetolactate synthase small subunit [Nitrospinota bacterium]MDH5755129.1 acetolactate synthase small subunit [Nitrospinota bacterium]
MRHTISVLVENKFGVLSRVSGLFSGRGFNIESLSVAPTLDQTTSRMTIITRGDDAIIEQITKQLNKLIDVIKVIDFSEEDFIERGIVLVKVNSEPNNRAEILRMTEIFRGKVVDVSPKTYTIEVTGAEEKVSAFVEMIKPLGIIEIARSGKIAMSRGKKTLG